MFQQIAFNVLLTARPALQRLPALPALLLIRSQELYASSTALFPLETAPTVLRMLARSTAPSVTLASSSTLSTKTAASFVETGSLLQSKSVMTTTPLMEMGVTLSVLLSLLTTAIVQSEPPAAAILVRPIVSTALQSKPVPFVTHSLSSTGAPVQPTVVMLIVVQPVKSATGQLNV